jgi:signal transduction histidine kinase
MTANLVSLDAQLIEVLPSPNETVLVLQADNSLLHARLQRARLPVRLGSKVRLAGICPVEALSFEGDGFGATPHAIELLLRSAADIEVLSKPSWWTAPRLPVAVSALLLAAMMSFIWIALLRQRVAAQAEVIREKAQREAALEERHRLAREMHDSLAQSFSGLAFQLDALQTRLPAGAAPARDQLETARQMGRHGQESFRRSMLNLRAQELEQGSLNATLADLARQITAGTGVDLQCNLRCPRARLAEAVEGNLLRVGQECLTNAIRHARPSRIEVSLDQESGALRLRICDDGLGMDLNKFDAMKDGHFGWRGIYERAEQIGARLEVNSRPGGGTAIVVTVPA